MENPKKQTSAALSSVEAGYMSKCQAAKEAIWLTGLLKDLGLDLRSPLTVYGDNQGALALTQNPVFHHIRNTPQDSIISLASSSRRNTSF